MSSGLRVSTNCCTKKAPNSRTRTIGISKTTTRIVAIVIKDTHKMDPPNLQKPPAGFSRNDPDYAQARQGTTQSLP